MKKIIVFIAIIVSSITVYAQSDNWYFSFSMGRSWPLGTFKQNMIDNNSSAFAMQGFDLLLDATYPVSDHWGLKGTVLVNTSPVDRNGLGTKLEKRMTSALIPFVEADRGYLSLRANAWMWNAVLAGPVYTVNFNRIYWDFQLLGGMNVTYLPQQKLLFEKPANDWYYVDRNTTNTNVSYGVLAGTAFRFPVADRINLKVAVDYYHSKAQVQYEQFKVSKQGETIITENLGKGSATIPIETVTGSIGFVYYFN